MNKIIQKSFLVISLVAFSGCGETKKEKTSYLCPTENALEVNALTLNVHENTFATTTKLLEDMNKSLVAFDKVNNDILYTAKLSMKLITELTKPFAFYDEATSPFLLNTDFHLGLPAFSIKPSTLQNKYLLVSSPSRLFPVGQSMKTLFNDPVTLTNAWDRAISNADSSKDLYVTILEIDDNASLKNLTNGLLVKSSQLH